MSQLILASSSEIRSTLLARAGIAHQSIPARIDEESAKAALISDRAKPRDIADHLAELKARKIAEKYPQVLVLGCDQVLDNKGILLSKPASADDTIAQLTSLQGATHALYSAIVLYQDGRPIWRHIAVAKLTMRTLSPAYIADYVTRNWPGLQNTVGCYKIEEDGLRLFSAIDGEHTAIQGLPIPPLIGYLASRGVVPS
jgi:septum formation protein